jgi:hypothetical protein
VSKSKTSSAALSGAAAAIRRGDTAVPAAPAMAVIPAFLKKALRLSP